MKVTKVCCQGCGADLQVDESIRFVTCNYCHTRLEIVHDTTVTHTRQLDKIEKNTGVLANKIQLLELQNDLERLDREWNHHRQSLLIRDKQGRVSEPSPIRSLAAGILAIGFGILWLVLAISMGAPGIFPLFGIVFVAFAVFNVIRGTTKGKAYQSHQHHYEVQRQQLVQRIEQQRRRG
jgi:hypothetical protein